MNPSTLVTGAGRGIGLELVRRLLARDYHVFATVRVGGSEELAAVGDEYPERMHEIQLDVTDPTSIERAVKEVAGHTDQLDLLINNAGIYPRDDGGVETIDLDRLVQAFQVNALGPLRVIRALLPLLRRGSGKRIIQMTSLMGSIGDNTSGGSYAYRISKTALNMANRNLAHELGPEGFICIAVHPGWVRTRMGGAGAPLDLREAAEQVLDNALKTTHRDSGTLRGPGGRELPF